MITKSQEKYIYKPAIKNADAIPMWFCFPSTHMIGMASLGYLHLFRLFDERPDVIPERIFTDTEKTTLSPDQVELMGFSFSFELDFLGMFKILEKYNIPFRAADRNDSHPKIFGGGPVLTANPEPYAEFFDFIITGDGEDAIDDVINNYKTLSGSSEKRTSKLDKCFYTPILTEKSVFPNMFMIEIARGCPKKCHFCLSSYLNLPARYPAVESIIEAIDVGLEHSNKIGLLGALITEHPNFDQICEHILHRRKEKEFEISVSSLRVDTISPLVIKTLVECGQKTSTIAIEAGSDRLRKKINKQLNEEDIFKGVKIARENGLKGLKVYGIIGLPGETNEDIQAFVDLMIRLKKENKGFNLTLSVSSFVPKRLTPYANEQRPDNKELEAKSNYLRKQLQMHKIQYKPTSLKWDYIQAILSTGDKSLSPVIKRVYELGGSLGNWNKALKEYSISY